MHAFICKLTCGSLSSCAWGGGPVGKNSVVFKNWKSLEKNTEGKKERGGGEREVDGETKREKRIGEEGGGFFSFFFSTTLESSYSELKVSSV